MGETWKSALSFHTGHPLSVLAHGNSELTGVIPGARNGAQARSNVPATSLPSHR